VARVSLVAIAPDAHPGVRWKRVKTPQAELSFFVSGRSPDSRVLVQLAFPGEPQWLVQRHSPLTVAGAVTDLVPFGYAAPCSLFLPLRIEALVEPVTLAKWQTAIRESSISYLLDGHWPTSEPWKNPG